MILRRPRRSPATEKLSAAEEYNRSIDPGTDNALGEISLVSGIIITPFDLQPEQVRIVDIAHALSRQCRFVGHCAGFLSVAEHSVRVAAIVEKTNPELALTGLLHDASDAYLGDVARPIKHLDGMAAYRDAEQRAERVISSVYGTVYPLPPEVIDADRQQLIGGRAGRSPRSGRVSSSSGCRSPMPTSTRRTCDGRLLPHPREPVHQAG